MVINAKKTDFDEVAQILNTGGIIIFPTETLYGLGCDATNPHALLKIYKLKQREFGKSFPILVRDSTMLAEYATFNVEQKKYLQTQGKKQPTNFVLKAKNISPLATKNHTGAFRISLNPWVKKFFKRFDKPLVATSANLSGDKPLTDSRKYQEIFGKDAELIDAVIFAGINKKRVGSRIIDLTQKPYKILRK